MLQLKLMGVLLVVALALGCAGNGKHNSTTQGNEAVKANESMENTDDAAADDASADDAAADDASVDDTSADDALETIDNTSEPVGDFEWVYVLNLHGVEPNSRKKIEGKLGETFLKDLSFHQVDSKEYQTSMVKYAGKKLLKIKVEYSYGNFDLSLLRSTIELDEGDAVEVPIPEYQDLRIQHAEDIGHFLKEIDFLLKEDRKNKESE